MIWLLLLLLSLIEFFLLTWLSKFSCAFPSPSPSSSSYSSLRSRSGFLPCSRAFIRCASWMRSSRCALSLFSKEVIVWSYSSCELLMLLMSVVSFKTSLSLLAIASAWSFTSFFIRSWCNFLSSSTTRLSLMRGSGYWRLSIIEESSQILLCC